MAASRAKFCTQAMDLKQFMLRQQVLALYRDIQRTLRKVPDAKDRDELHRWARDEFKRNKHHSDEITIKMLLTQGKQTVRELEGSLHLARCIYHAEEAPALFYQVLHVPAVRRYVGGSPTIGLDFTIGLPFEMYRRALNSSSEAIRKSCLEYYNRI